MAVTTADAPKLARHRGAEIAASDRLPLITKLTLISLLIPIQFYVGDLLMTPARVIFLVTVPIFFVQLFSGRLGRLIMADFLVLAYGAWMAISVAYHVRTMGTVLPFVGSNVLIILGGYLTARATIRSPAQFYAFVKLLVICIVLLIPLALPELLSPDPTRSEPNMLLPPLIEQIPFVESGIRDALYPPREAFGILFDRAQTVFPHPIHYGLFCSGAFGLVFIGTRAVWGPTKRYVLGAIVMFACFCSLSSGPLLAAFAQVGLIGYRWIAQNIKMRWQILGISITVVYSILEVLSTRIAIFVIVSYIAFSPATAFNRRLLFDYGTQQIKRTPIMGNGFQMNFLPWWMKDSMDNQWLLAAVVYGLPSMIFLFLFFLTPMLQASRQDFSKHPELNEIRFSWVIVIVSLMLCMATVALWGQIYTYYFMIVGAGAWIIHYDTGQLEADKEAEAARPRAAHGRYTRFPNGKPLARAPAPARQNTFRRP